MFASEEYESFKSELERGEDRECVRLCVCVRACVCRKAVCFVMLRPLIASLMEPGSLCGSADQMWSAAVCYICHSLAASEEMSERIHRRATRVIARHQINSVTLNFEDERITCWNWSPSYPTPLFHQASNRPSATVRHVCNIHPPSYQNKLGLYLEVHMGRLD